MLNLPSKQILDENCEKFIKKVAARSPRSKKMVHNLLETTRGFPCTLSEWFPDKEPAWVVPGAWCVFFAVAKMQAMFVGTNFLFRDGRFRAERLMGDPACFLPKEKWTQVISSNRANQVQTQFLLHAPPKVVYPALYR
jgi:hypothetical protein